MTQLGTDLNIGIDHLSAILSNNLGFENALSIKAIPATAKGKAAITIYYPGNYDPYPQEGYIDHVEKSIVKSRIAGATSNILDRQQLPEDCQEELFDAGKEIRMVSFTANAQQLATLARQIELASRSSELF